MAALVLFGGGGDLAMRMLLPSLYFLEYDGRLPDGLKVISAARKEETREAYVARVRDSVQSRADGHWDPAAFDRLAARLDYVAVDATSADDNSAKNAQRLEAVLRTFSSRTIMVWPLLPPKQRLQQTV